MRVLVLGGYGNFGARISRALARRGIEVIAAGRDPDQGHRRAGFDSRVGKLRLDTHDSNFAAAIKKNSPAVVIHCVGPFQGQSYRVASDVLAAGAHYIDLADARKFVVDFTRAVDPLARAAGKVAVTGASTLPAVSSAVIDALKTRLATLDEIQICIAPAQRAPRGAATLKAVFSYLGEPFPWWTDGSWQTAYGWQERRRVQVAELGERWSAACDVPDLELFPARYHGVKTVQFRAALEIGLQHYLLAVAAQLHRWGLPIPAERWAAPLDRAASWLDRFGTERGGMLVSVTGTRQDGKRCRLDWHLVADHNHGPEIPGMASTLLAEKLLRGDTAATGAMPCMGLVTLADLETEFTRWGMRTQVVETLL